MSLLKPPTLPPGLRRRLACYGPLLLTLFCGALAAVPLFSNTGFLMTRGGGDSPFLLLRLHQLLAALGAGEFPARWMPDAAYGYGFPFFSYYAALPYYLAALLRLYGFSYVAALKLTQLGALLAAAAGVYAWARLLPLSRPRAVLAAAAYTFAPFHLVNLYVRGDSLSELWAMAFYPWILWGLQRCLARPGLGRALVLALLVGGLAFSHNISALNFMPFAGLYGLLAAWTQFRRCRAAAGATMACARPGVVALLALAWGLGLAAFFWLPALREVTAVQIGEVTEGYFFYGNHFRAANLVQTSLFYSAETGVGQPTPFAMGLAQAVAGGLGLAAWLWGTVRARRWTATDTFLLAGLVISTWMITPYSAWVWEHLPFIGFTQFPWRFLSIQALFVAVITAHLVPETVRPGATGAWRRWAAAGGVALALAVLGLGGLRPDFVPLRDADVTAARLQLLEYFSANIGSTIGYEYLPRAVAPRPFVSEQMLGRAPQLKALQGAAAGALLSQRGSRQTWTIAVTQGPATVALPTYDWPGWTARVDGQAVPLRATEGLGWITLDVPEGAHTVTLALGRTPVRAAAEWVSALLLMVPLALLAYRRRIWSVPRHVKPTRGLALALGLLVLGAIALRVGPAAAPAGPLSMDFVQLAFPHYAPVRFADGAALLDVQYSTETPARGETLTVRSRWQAGATAEVVFELRPASNLLNAVPVILASAAHPFAAGNNVALEHQLNVPENIPPGMYFVTVSVSEAGQTQAAITLTGRERGLIHLAPVVIDDVRATTNTAAPLASFGPAIDLLDATLAPAGPEGARLDLRWLAREAVPGNYLLAVRLRDAGGLEWSGLDAQTAYGYYPTHLWRAGEVVPDFYGLPLEAGTPPGDYALTLDLRDPGTDSSLGGLGGLQLTLPLTITTPAGDRQRRFALLPELALAEVGFPAQIEQGDAPELRAGWLTLEAPAADYRARWTLTSIDSSSGQAPVTQVLDLAPGSSPSRWPAGAYVLGRVRFGTAPTLAPGAYQLSVQLEDAAGQTVGEAADVGRMEVTGRARSFEVPPLETEVGATFGGRLKLWGYDAERDASSLRLTLVWGALDAPGRDYKFFVHLFNEADGFVAAQVDAMPRDFTYPTALWVAGEVVSDTVTLPLAGLPPGRYGVAVGWYDPAEAGLPRLEAVDAAGHVLAENRVVLPEIVISD